MLSLKLSPDFAESIQLAAAGCLVTLWLLWRTKQLYESFGRNQVLRARLSCHPYLNPCLTHISEAQKCDYLSGTHLVGKLG